MTINWKITNFIHCFPFLSEPVTIAFTMEKHVFGIEMLLIIIFAADLCYQQWNTIIPQYLIAKSHMGYRIYIYSINAKKINFLFYLKYGRNSYCRRIQKEDYFGRLFSITLFFILLVSI